MTETLVRFENINFRRDGNVILKDVSWTIRPGQQWVLLGLNGSGKSTLLSMIPAYTYPTKGKVFVFDKQFGKYQWEKIRRRVGFLSSTLNIFNRTLSSESVKRIILSGRFASFGVYEDPTQADLDRVEGLVEAFELEKIADRPFFPLSEGEKRRTLIARAFMANPDLMILDEPCASLDLRARERLLRTLSKAMHEETFPLIYVTHQIDEILPEITHVAILDQGIIRFQGPKDQVLTDETLTDLYGFPVSIHWQNGRPFAIFG